MAREAGPADEAATVGPCVPAFLFAWPASLSEYLAQRTTGRPAPQDASGVENPEEAGCETNEHEIALLQALRRAMAADKPEIDDPFVAAAAGGDADTLRRLLSNDADVHRAASNGLTALVAAVMAGNDGCVSLLLERGAEPDRRPRPA